jgi:hypothetical protein
MSRQALPRLPKAPNWLSQQQWMECVKAITNNSAFRIFFADIREEVYPQ